MEWENTPESTNIDDRRGQSGGGVQLGGTGGLGLGAIIVLALIGYFTGIDPRVLIGGAEMVTGAGHGTISQSAGNVARPSAPVRNDSMKTFVAHVLGETEAVWAEVLPAQMPGVPGVAAPIAVAPR